MSLHMHLIFSLGVLSLISTFPSSNEDRREMEKRGGMRKKTAKNGSAELMNGRRGCFYGGRVEKTNGVKNNDHLLSF
ncbi:MAG TPA: hypothetical protein VFV38_18935 [Ktedonobacteraceae bacterium]|nr:hypothetical protein [Ktedonobacteraceae bacterium]